MNAPFARAVVGCDEPGCPAIVELRAGPTTVEKGGGDAEALIPFIRPAAEALGWQCAMEGDPLDDRPGRFDIPGAARVYERNAPGRDLCPKHRTDK